MVEQQMKILIVDDEIRNTELLEALLHVEGYATLSAENGEKALALAASERPDLVLLDIMMPGMDGYQVAGRLKADQATRNIPVIMVTALESRDAKLMALNAGAEEFLTKPVDRAELRVRVRNMLRLKEYSDFLDQHNQRLEALVAERTRALSDAYKDTIFTMVRAAEHKDEETGLHVRRISHYSKLLADELHLEPDFSESMFHASPMHDIGKIGIPDHILFKPASFTPDEWAIMKTHCALGAHILNSGNSPYVRLGAQIALNHHERWDGSGYPAGLAGEAIPLAARIMCIGDIYDALRSKRPYKKAYDHATAVSIILEGDDRTRPGHFDPAVLAVFATCHERFARIYEAHTDVR